MEEDGVATQARAKSQNASAPDGQVASAVSQGVGEALRAWRREAGLSIREVAERSGLSVSFISLLERGRTEVAVTRLIRLTDVFGRQITDLIGGVSGDLRGPSVSEDDPYGRSVKAYGLADGVELVYMGEPAWAMQPFIFVLEPGAVHGPVIHSYSEHVVCLDGEGTIVIGSSQTPMAAGDILTIEPNTHHAYMNRSSSTCRLLAVDFRGGDDVRVLLDTYDQIQRSRRPRVHQPDGDRAPDDTRSQRTDPEAEGSSLGF